MKTLSGLLLALTAFALTGCGTTPPLDAPHRVTTKGKVLLPDGQPLRAGRIVFVPVAGGDDVVAEVGTGGEFEAKAIPGDYKIKIELVTYKKGTAEPVKLTVPQKYLTGGGEQVTLSADKSDYTVKLTY